MLAPSKFIPMSTFKIETFLVKAADFSGKAFPLDKKVKERFLKKLSDSQLEYDLKDNGSNLSNPGLRDLTKNVAAMNDFANGRVPEAKFLGGIAYDVALVIPSSARAVSSQGRQFSPNTGLYLLPQATGVALAQENAKRIQEALKTGDSVQVSLIVPSRPALKASPEVLKNFITTHPMQEVAVEKISAQEEVNAAPLAVPVRGATLPERPPIPGGSGYWKNSKVK